MLDRLRAAGVDAPVVVGGIIPPEDAEVLRGKGVAAVYTPKDFEFERIMDDLVDLVERSDRAARRLSPSAQDPTAGRGPGAATRAGATTGR